MKTYYPKLAKNQAYPIGTLCEFCRNSIPDNKGHGCPWSRMFQPVEGWIATPVSRLFGGRPQQTYCVHECPSFLEEPERLVQPEQAEVASA